MEAEPLPVGPDRKQTVNAETSRMSSERSSAAFGAPPLDKLPKAVTGGAVVLKLLDGVLKVAVARDPEKGPDAWVLPKGHIREHETPADAALRETREEVGATDVELICHLGVVRRRSLQDWGELVDKDIHLFLGYSHGPAEIRPASEEPLVESRWMPLADVIARLPWIEEREFLTDRLGPLLQDE